MKRLPEQRKSLSNIINIIFWGVLNLMHFHYDFETSFGFHQNHQIRIRSPRIYRKNDRQAAFNAQLQNNDRIIKNNERN